MNHTLFTLKLKNDNDVILTCVFVRRVAKLLNINAEDQTQIVAVAAEIAREAIHSGGGAVDLAIERARPASLVVQVRIDARAAGQRVMSGEGYGSELPRTIYAASQMVDVFEISSKTEGETVIRTAKVLPFSFEVSDGQIRRLQKEIVETEAENLVEEFAVQHRELLLALENLRTSRRQLTEVTRELAETNLGVVALNADLEKAVEEKQKQADFERQLIGIVSHDLRNPISNAVVTARMLLAGGNLKDQALWGIRLIISSAERALRMMEDLLDFTKSRMTGIPIRPKPVALNNLVETVISEMRGGYPHRNIVFKPSGEVTAYCDGDRITQVITNLLTNALHYSPEETDVEVRTRPQEGEVVIEVHNWGAPIPPDFINSAFEPFKRGPGAGKASASRGIGLGLYIVNQIVRGHGGSIRVESSAEKGTVFIVHLPCGASND